MIYQTCGLYKVWWSLYNIKQPCTNHRTCAPYTLSTVLTETLWNIDRLGENYQTCRLYKVWASLYNIDPPYRNHRTCALYKVWSSLYNINRRGQNSRSCRCNIRSSGLCIMFTGLTNFIASGLLCIISTGLAKPPGLADVI
jgi:hypothetical protein